MTSEYSTTSELTSDLSSQSNTLTETVDSERENIDLKGDIIDNYNIISELGNVRTHVYG